LCVEADLQVYVEADLQVYVEADLQVGLNQITGA